MIDVAFVATIGWTAILALIVGVINLYMLSFVLLTLLKKDEQ